MTEFDVVVIGLGGVGSFALRALTQQGQRQVLGLERFTRGHAFGSSHGASRVYRHAYFEHPDYCPLLKYSTSSFKSLQESSGVKLLEECGTLIMEDVNGPVIAACNESAQKHDIAVEHLANNDLKVRYPQFKCSENMVGILEKSGGFVRPERAILAALQEAEEGGATVWENTAVNTLREVTNDDGSIHVDIVVHKGKEEEEVVVKAKSVVISAGAWTATLIPSWAPYLKVTRQIQAWIDMSSSGDPSLYDPTNMPTWFKASPNAQMPLYGIPADPESESPHWIKAALHGREVPVDPDKSDPIVTADELKELQEATHTFVSASDLVSWPSAKSCLYTVTPDKNFIVGRPSGYHRTYAAAGLSGHGFKMTPALGKILADFAVTGTSSLNADFLSPARYGI